MPTQQKHGLECQINAAELEQQEQFRVTEDLPLSTRYRALLLMTFPSTTQAEWLF
jgi:hypothetical protein